MAIELYSPSQGDSVSNPVSLSWEYASTFGQDAVYINDGNQWIIVNDYSCSGSVCSASYDYGQLGAQEVRIYMNGEFTDTVQFTIEEGNTGNPDDIIGTVQLAEGSVVTLAPDAMIDLGTGMTAEQMTEIGGSIVLALAVAGAYRVVKQFMLNNR
jgi:hypothetical protein